jgi:murein DD-endopeptidase MepM/ murein hydrolase activator NlpD
MRPPFWNRWRATGYVVLLGLAASPLGFQIYPSSHDDDSSPLSFRLPLDGPVTVGWGGATPDVNYHAFAPDQRWAFDLGITKDSKSFHGDVHDIHNSYSYGIPVLAPAEGLVYDTSDGDPDMPIGILSGGKDACGNQVVLEVAPRQFMFLCHLQPGSIPVKKGEHVREGQMVGRVGNSGNTYEPHLHMHLQDGPKLHLAEGIPLYFRSYRVGARFVERGIPTGGTAREIVEHVARGPEPGSR